MLCYYTEPPIKVHLTESQLIMLAEGADLQLVYNKYYQNSYDWNTFQEIALLDPTSKGGTQKGKYMVWLLKNYNTKGESMFTPHIAKEINEALKWFSTHNHLMDKGDINQYSVETLVDTYYEKVNSLLTQSEIKQQTDVLYDSSDWKIVTPLSHGASCYYGANTKWCTATKNDDSYFNDYSENGLLLININKETNEKYQMYIEDGNPGKNVICDAEDTPISVQEMNMPQEVYTWYLETFSDEYKGFAKWFKDGKFPPNGAIEIFYDEANDVSAYLLPSSLRHGYYYVGTKNSNEERENQAKYYSNSFETSSKCGFILTNEFEGGYDLYNANDIENEDEYYCHDTVKKYEILFDNTTLITLDKTNILDVYTWGDYCNYFNNLDRWYHIEDYETDNTIIVLKNQSGGYIILSCYNFESNLAYNVTPPYEEYDGLECDSYLVFDDNHGDYIFYKEKGSDTITMKEVETRQEYSVDYNTFEEADTLEELKEILGIE